MHDAKGTGSFELLLDAIRQDKNPMTSDRTNWIAHTAVYKINTCKSTCFDNLEKKSFCSCSCNDETFSISFQEDQGIRRHMNGHTRRTH